MSDMGPGCMKTDQSRRRSELFLNCLLPAPSTSAFGCRNDEIEMKILGTGNNDSPSSRQQLVEQRKARLKAGLFFHRGLS